MKTNVPLAALAPHWPEGQVKPKCRPSGNLDLVYAICLGGSEILKIIFPSNLKSQSARLAVVESKDQQELAQVILKAIEIKNITKKMKQQYEKDRAITNELRKQYSLALLRFKFAERKVYPETCVIRVIVQEPSNSAKKKIEHDLGSEDEDDDSEFHEDDKEPETQVTKKEDVI